MRRYLVAAATASILGLAALVGSAGTVATASVAHNAAVNNAAVNDAAAPSRHPADQTAHAFNGNRRIGALYLPDFYPGLHFCTASVVRSPGHNVIMTAAHCMNPGSGKNYEFVPGYHGGHAPYGVWTTTGGYAAPKWIKEDGNTRRDFVFLTVAPRTIGGKLKEIQSVVGANRLGRRATKGEHVQITGYPLGIRGRPITCSTHVYLHKGYPGSHCYGFKDGTSGGPWVNGKGHNRTVVGLISGLHQGGCTPKVVYSTPLGKPAHKARRRAEHHRHPDTFPDRPSDGCKSDSNL